MQTRFLKCPKFEPLLSEPLLCCICWGLKLDKTDGHSVLLPELHLSEVGTNLSFSEVVKGCFTLKGHTKLLSCIDNEVYIYMFTKLRCADSKR